MLEQLRLDVASARTSTPVVIFFMAKPPRWLIATHWERMQNTT
jgi:hypothetical protein